jgi:Ca-activated chloride channel family protein
MKTTIFAFIILSSSILFAGSSGKIKGKVTDAETGAPLIGVNIIIEGTTLGAPTDTEGEFLIRNVPPGTYSIIASFVGYRKTKIQNVEVTAGAATDLNITLQQEAIVTEECVVRAARYLIEKSVTSCSKIVSAEDIGILHNTEEYDRIVENTFYDVIESPLSTFAADVDAASYSNARRFLMQSQLPYKDAVRAEEFINYFSYDYPQPKNGHPLSINLEYSDCPWNKDHKLVHIGLQGKQLSKQEQKPSNLVFLIDVSGSMSPPNKLPLLKRSFKLMVGQLKPEDKIAIVVYASSTGLVLPATAGSDKDKIIKALDRLQAGGSTAGGAGIQLAYKIAEENFIEDGNNRVILATDGDFNVGISSTSELVRYIESKRDNGIYLTVLGFGMGNYKDDRLQELADRGNGNHAYIDNILEAKKVLVTEITSTLFTIAKDVKIQVEFNPAKVKSYRLVGYENRLLEDKDFEDDTKDAGEIGSGHTVTVLYEIVPAENNNFTDRYDLKYQETRIRKDAYNTEEVLTVRIRYKDPDKDDSYEFSEVLTGYPVEINKSSDNFRFSSAVAEFAMILRDSKFKGTANIGSVRELAESSAGKDEFGYRDEFLNLVERVEVLMSSM